MYSIPQIALAMYSAIAPAAHSVPVPRAGLDVAMLMGFFAMLATLLCYVERRRSLNMRFALGVCLLLTAVFGFTERAWPLALLQVVWAGVAFGRWWSMARQARRGEPGSHAKTWHRRPELFASEYSNN